MPYKNKEDRNAHERQRRAEGHGVYQHDWYENNKARLSRTAIARRQELYQYIIQVKTVPCLDCHKNYPPYVMDFDHVRGAKLFNIGHYGSRSLAALKAEIVKCDVVCANCHRERTHGLAV